MAIYLESTVKRFIGDSSDAKPKLGLRADGSTPAKGDLPVGSTLYLTDLGIIERWDGVSWRRNPPDSDSVPIIEEIRLLRLEVAALRLGMIEAGTCKDEDPADVAEFAL